MSCETLVEKKAFRNSSQSLILLGNSSSSQPCYDVPTGRSALGEGGRGDCKTTERG